MITSWLLAGAAFVLLATCVDGKKLDKTVENTIEARVIVDKYSFKRWKSDPALAKLPDDKKIKEAQNNMKAFINGVFAGLNSIFKLLEDADINLDARIVDIQFSDEDFATSKTSGNKIDRNKILDDFKTWLKTKKYPTTDHHLLLTGLDLTETNGDPVVAGVATKGRMCDPVSSLSAVEDSRAGTTVLVLAHELGHSMNASHDAEGNKCSDSSYQVMNTKASVGSHKNFQFSECSHKYIRDYLQSLIDKPDGSCLSKANTKTKKPTAPKQLGEIYDPDTVCKMANGPKHFFARKFYEANKYEKLCTTLTCSENEKSGTNRIGTDGFVCGKGKRCTVGFCKKSSSAPTDIEDTCPFGDTPAGYPVYKSKDCQKALPTDDKSICYHNSTNQACCDLCAKAATGPKDCKYGNKAPSCSTWTSVAGCYEEKGRDLCCGFCKKHETTDPNCKYGDRASNCKLSMCAIESNRKVCCKTCKTVSSDKDCPYGDTVSNCKALVEKHGKKLACPQLKKKCCATCKDD